MATTFTENVVPEAETWLAADKLGLLERAKQGERHALFALFQAHARRVYSLSLKVTGDVTAAENLTRDIFIEAFNCLDTVADDAAFAASLYCRAAKKVLANRFRRSYPEGSGHQIGSHQHLSFTGRGELAIHPDRSMRL